MLFAGSVFSEMATSRQVVDWNSICGRPWHEFCHITNEFQPDTSYNTKAVYTLKEEDCGTLVHIKNSTYKVHEKRLLDKLFFGFKDTTARNHKRSLIRKTYEAEALVSESLPNSLHVSPLPGFLAPIGFLCQENFIIHKFDEVDYEWMVVVGHDRLKYAWALTRSARPSASTKKFLTDILVDEIGVDPELLRYSLHLSDRTIERGYID